MSKIAVFKMFCCTRLFMWGRDEGKRDSSSGFYPQAWCHICDPYKEKLPRPNEKKATCDFAGYLFDDIADRPFAITHQVRFLSVKEIETFKKINGDYHG